MATQYQLIVNKILARAATLGADGIPGFGTNVFNDLNAAGLVFKPTHSAAYVTAECHRYIDFSTRSVDVAKLAFTLDQSQQGFRVVTDQVGGG